MAVSRTLGAPSAPRGQRSGSKDPKASRSCNATATNAEHGKVEAAEPLQRLRFLHSTVAFHAAPKRLRLRRKGWPPPAIASLGPTTIFRPELQGSHAPPVPLQWPAVTHSRPPVARIARVRAHPCTAALPAARAFAVNRAPRSPPSFTPRRLAAAMLLLPAPHSARAHRMMHSWRMS